MGILNDRFQGIGPCGDHHGAPGHRAPVRRWAGLLPSDAGRGSARQHVDLEIGRVAYPWIACSTPGADEIERLGLGGTREGGPHHGRSFLCRPVHSGWQAPARSRTRCCPRADRPRRRRPRLRVRAVRYPLGPSDRGTGLLSGPAAQTHGVAARSSVISSTTAAARTRRTSNTPCGCWRCCRSWVVSTRSLSCAATCARAGTGPWHWRPSTRPARGRSRASGTGWTRMSSPATTMRNSPPSSTPGARGHRGWTPIRRSGALQQSGVPWPLSSPTSASRI
jgi:hypothetical protein